MTLRLTTRPLAAWGRAARCGLTLALLTSPALVRAQDDAASEGAEATDAPADGPDVADGTDGTEASGTEANEAGDPPPAVVFQDGPVPELDDPPLAPSASPTLPEAPDARGEDPFAAVPELLDTVPDVWVLDDGVDDPAVPWDAYDPVTEYQPRGLYHAGVQLRVAALPGGADPLPEGPMIEVGVFGDVRFARRSAWHLRAVLAVAWQPHSEEFLGGGVSRYTSPFSARLRILPIAVDLGNYFAIRVGPSIGVQWVPRPDSDGGAAEIFGGGTAEAVVRLLDGFLEIGAVAGMQLTAYGELSRPAFWQSRVDPQAVLGGTVGMIIP